jgi:hypothetical protein
MTVKDKVSDPTRALHGQLPRSGAQTYSGLVGGFPTD